MNAVRITITGSDKTISELEAFLREEKIQVEKGAVAVNDATTIGLSVLYIIAKFDVIPKCITAFRASRKATIRFTRFVEGKGFEEFESYDPDAVSKVLAQTNDIHIKDYPTDEFSNPKPLATAEQFKAALRALEIVGIPHKHLDMLKAHCHAPNHTISTGQLAKEVGYPGNKTVNLQYGTLAHRVALELHHYKHPTFSTGNPHWWRTLASGNDGTSQNEDGHYEWIMRPELVQALQEMGWA
jgi:hypothetical protein